MRKTALVLKAQNFRIQDQSQETRGRRSVQNSSNSHHFWIRRLNDKHNGEFYRNAQKRLYFVLDLKFLFIYIIELSHLFLNFELQFHAMLSN